MRREPLAIIWNRRQSHRLVVTYIDPYNRHRPHRSLQDVRRSDRPPRTKRAADVIRLSRCDGLINAYTNAA